MAGAPRGRPRALLLCTDPGVPLDGPAGASAHLRGVGRGLFDLGYEVVPAVLRRADARGVVDDAWDGPIVEVSPTPRHGFGRLREVVEARDGARLRRAAAALGPWDVVWERFALGGAGGARLGARHVLEVNAPIGRERGDQLRSAAWVRHVERATLRRAGDVIAVSPWLVRWCAERGVTARLVRQGSGLPPGDRARGRAHLTAAGVPPTSAPLVGWHGAFRPWHGLDRLPRLADALAEAHFVVVGEGPAPPPPHPRVHRLPRLAGQTLADVIAAFDVSLGLLAAAAPPWLAPLKIADALAQGIPVVTGAAEGAVALLDGRGGVVVDDDPTAWAAAIRQAAAEPRRSVRRSWADVVGEALDTP